MSVTLQTSLGDIKLELHCELCPRTCENFLALCASGYYNNNIIHRNIKGFMFQTGDPAGTGKGGDSIFGGPIEDEFHVSLKHTERGILSMAGNGPNTSKSQFFIAYAKHSSLDLKYTIFGSNLSNNPKSASQETARNSDHSINDPLKKRIDEINEYFDQYIEEYYEQVDGSAEKVPTPKLKAKQDRFNRIVSELESCEKPINDLFSVDEVVRILELESVEDLVCIEIPASLGKCMHLIICSPVNQRHCNAIVENLRKCVKTRIDVKRDQMPMLVKEKTDWYCMHIGEIAVHIMTRKLRKEYDLESLWSGYEDDDYNNSD